MMVDEGVLDGVSGVFGMHVWPLYPSGVAAIRVGHVLGPICGCQAFTPELHDASC